ncbi:MAG: DNA polymerase/3'-5' exonuclease PolX [bacterium]
MPVHNTDIAAIFNQVADLLEIKGENAFRVRAYRDAARTVGGLSSSAADMVKKNEDLSRLSGIGKDLAGKIKEIVETGKLPLLEDLKKEVSPALSKLLNIAGLGPKRVKTLHEKLGITTISDLKKAAENGKIREISGFGEKTEQSILEGIQGVKEEKGRIRLLVAREIAEDYRSYLQKVDGVKDVEVAGSYRRHKETVGDLDILVTCTKGSPVMDRFVKYEDVDTVVSHGDMRSTVILRSGTQVDLRVFSQESYGAAIHYFTGSKAHNIAIRKIGVKKGLKINEYGIFKGKKRIAGKREEDVFVQVGLPFIPPELREGRGEVEAAREGRLPDLITLDHIKGDLHTHTNRTDGHFSLEEMVKAAKERGYEYMAITEHSKRVTMAHGLDKKALATQIKEIDALNGRQKAFFIVKGVEVDILEDGSLDLPDDILKELDLTVCSVHYNAKLSRQKQTKRIIRAMDNPYFTILGHPTGRLIKKRPPYEVDMEKIMQAAAERGCLLELNAHPVRLDLNDIHCKMAKEKGLKIVISTDAHSIRDLDFMAFGVGQARRGWLEPEDVLNSRSWKQVKRLLRRK